ncbi:uncharacterized protein LOC132276806 [Cornus florida]|uniref:uncharacterized protein LOC132276806 n=1 Tax=Cornus florida TaxID=4283 RepID=UPI00289CE669|nr:uncharacterized protein LOC132276806 [Cornus florida]XP_059634402.1 uncharacterized protein LOC132276806 [Cornus florida]
MAAAEVRAAWQRTANRCFVQEDAKRAPKLACGPSASSSSKQGDAGPANATDGKDNPTVGFIPLHRNPSHSNPSPDSRWWLHLQPNYGYQRGLTNEQLNTLEAEMETFRAGVASSTSTFSDVHQQNEVDGTHVNDNMNSEHSSDAYSVISATCVKKDLEVRKPELKARYTKNDKEHLNLKDMGESYELIDVDPVGSSVSKESNELCFDFESPWVGGVKSEPWWRKADRAELASLVAQRSVDFIENCDLPQPQNTHVKRDTFAHIGCFDCDGFVPSSLQWKAQSGLSNPTAHTKGCHSFRSACEKQWTSVEGSSQYDSNKRVRNSDDTMPEGVTETQVPESDPSKAELLEALRHSQTRAREAENAAKQAYEEKEHIVRLFFRQASHLFAYKQWFQLLQLENLYFQIKNNHQPISTIFPVVLPWMPQKTRKLQKDFQKAAKGKRGRPRYESSKFSLAFALGLSLVGAGLLLGWTVGWMLPTL